MLLRALALIDDLRLMALLINLVLGLVPTLILGGSIAAGVEDDAGHRRTFLLVYALWALTLAMWNWISSAHIAWALVWGFAGAFALAWWTFTRRTSAG